MNTGMTLFAQLKDFLPWKTFHRIVTRYVEHYRIRALPCSEHFRILAFAQLTYRESLRDIEACLSAQAAKLYHMGIRSPVKRATLADANERRDWPPTSVGLPGPTRSRPMPSSKRCDYPIGCIYE